MRTSEPGIAFIERHEGVVLKAYRCPAGRWTIGAGLTSASGVVRVEPGMRITAKEASRMLALALAKNYEPRVAGAMPGAEQHEFDAGVSFDFNTGAINRASWVKYWIARNWSEVERRLKMWRKGGGKVLPGLERRRQEEYDLMRWRDYGDHHRPSRPAGMARLVLDLSGQELDAARAAFRKLGYDPGADPSGILETAVRAFQREHDLTVDGIVGRATLSTLQRRMDAPKKVATTTAATAAGGGGLAAADGAEVPAAVLVPPHLLWFVLAAGALWLLCQLWSYRDVIAVKLQSRSPKLAAWLRRF